MYKKILILILLILASTLFLQTNNAVAETICEGAAASGGPQLNIWPISEGGEDCTDYSLLAARNVTQGGGYTTGNINASAGDIIRVRLYVHNGVLDFPENIANNVQVSASLPAANGGGTINAEAWASNHGSISSASKGGDVNISLGGTEKLQYINSSALVYGRYANLLGGFSDNVVSGGASLGDMRGCFDFLRFVTFEARVIETIAAPVGNIEVQSNIPTSWVINGPDNFSGSGVYAFYANARTSPSDYFINLPIVAGYNPPIVNPSVSQTLNANQTIRYTIFYSVAVGPTPTPSPTPTPTPTPGPTPSPTPTPTPVPTPTPTPTPVPPPPPPPLDKPVVNVSNANCSELRITWSDIVGEDLYTVWRSTNPVSGFVQVSALGANQTEHIDRPAVGIAYFYFVRAIRHNPSSQADSIVFGPIVNRICAADLEGSSKNLISITDRNGVVNPYSTSVLILKGDVLKFRVVISNTGTAPAMIYQAIDVHTPNLTNLRNVRVDKGSGFIPVATAGNIIHISGNKEASGRNWILEYEMTVDSTSTTAGLEEIKNCITINYTDPTGMKNVTKCFGPILYKKPSSGAPTFREMAG